MICEKDLGKVKSRKGRAKDKECKKRKKKMDKV